MKDLEQIHNITAVTIGTNYYLASMVVRSQVTALAGYGLTAGLMLAAFAFAGSRLFPSTPAADAYITIVASVFLLMGIYVAFRARPAKPAGDVVEGNCFEMLSKREKAVLPLLYSGKSNKEIAAELNIGLSTLKTHINTIYKKAGVRSRQELVEKRPAAEL